jgi:hypothetical protein
MRNEAGEMSKEKEKKSSSRGQTWWCTPLIPATGEEEV